MQVKCVSENIYKKKLCKSSLGVTSGGKLAHDASVRCGWNIRLIFRETEHLRIIGLSYVSVRLPKVKLSHTQLPLKLLLREPRWASQLSNPICPRDTSCANKHVLFFCLHGLKQCLFFPVFARIITACDRWVSNTSASHVTWSTRVADLREVGCTGGLLRCFYVGIHGSSAKHVRVTVLSNVER